MQNTLWSLGKLITFLPYLPKNWIRRLLRLLLTSEIDITTENAKERNVADENIHLYFAKLTLQALISRISTQVPQTDSVNVDTRTGTDEINIKYSNFMSCFNQCEKLVKIIEKVVRGEL